MNPCQYCDTEAVEIRTSYWYGNPYAYHVQCPSCYSRGPVRKEQHEAIKCWNGELKLIREEKR